MSVCVCVCVQFGKTPLMHAIKLKQKNSLDIVKLLVESNANMDAKDNVSGVAVRVKVTVRF